MDLFSLHSEEKGSLLDEVLGWMKQLPMLGNQYITGLFSNFQNFTVDFAQSAETKYIGLNTAYIERIFT